MLQCLLHKVSRHIRKILAANHAQQIFLISVQISDKIREPQGERVPLVSRRQLPFFFNKTLPCQFPLGVDFILRGRYALQIIRIMVFFFGIELAVILNKLPQAFFCLRPTQHKVVFSGNAATVNGDALAAVPHISLRAV